VTSISEITRLIASIEDWKHEHGKAGGRAEAARRLDEARRLLDEASNMLVDIRKDLLGSGRQR
jgi:hypothetical protein